MDQYQANPPTSNPYADHEGYLTGESTSLGKPKGFAWLAWLGITVLVIAVIGARYLDTQVAEEEPQSSDEMGELMMKFQSRYMIGSAELVAGSGGDLFTEAEELLNTGSVGQRQRFVILASELASPFAAREALDQLESDIADPPDGNPPVLSTEQEELQVLLYKLYGQAFEFEPENAHLERIDALSANERQSLIDNAGWFGELALVPLGTIAEAEREVITSSATLMATLIIIIFILIAIIGFIGFAGLISVGVLTLVGKIKSQMTLAGNSHGIYAETFALWLFCFFVLQIAVQLLVNSVPELVDHVLFISFITFMISLLLLAWPVLRGISWSEVRQDIGWTSDRLRGLELFIGIAGYVMTLPLLAFGVLLVFILLIIQGVFAGPQPTFAPSGGPAHPIIMNLANGDLWTYIQIYLVATVGAPIVEETMFRGVLYQHLRSASRNVGVFVSILFSTTLNTFIFAAIHPQGWVAIPALMSLAIGFTLLREWRGTLIPSIFVHAISNGLVMSMMIFLL